MGVARLYSFLKSIGAVRKVNIVEEADHHRRNKQNTPMIAVDGINLMYSIYRYHHIPSLFGGQLKEYMEHLEHFIESFLKEGIDLIFFFDGVNVMFNVDSWIKRKRKTVKEVHNIFNKIEQNMNLSDLEKAANCFVLPKNIWEITQFVLKNKGCKIIITVGECDRELASFGRENQCMGILATDTDLIVYDSVPIFTTLGMNLHDMNFYVYDKRKLLEVLMLKSCELPLLASLVGNDYTADLDVKYFKKTDRFEDINNKFHKTAHYIRKLNLKFHSGKLQKSDIAKISRNFFGDEKISQILEESLNFYNIQSKENGLASIMCGISDYKWKSIIKMFYEEFNSNGDSLGILFRLCFQDTISLQDFRRTDISPVPKILKQLREKIYGILLIEKPGSKKVTEWLIDGYESLGKPDEVCPQYPNVYHPGLLCLIRGHNKDASWTLLGDIFNVEPSYVKNFKEHLLIPALAFRYLKDKVLILQWEIDALILSAILVRYFDVQRLRWIKPNKLKSRPVRLYNLITCCFEMILQIFQILGNLISVEESLPSNYQDGILFHFLYELSQEEHNKSWKEVLEVVFNCYLKNTNNEAMETSKELFDLVSSFIEK